MMAKPVHGPNVTVTFAVRVVTFGAVVAAGALSQATAVSPFAHFPVVLTRSTPVFFAEHALICAPDEPELAAIARPVLHMTSATSEMTSAGEGSRGRRRAGIGSPWLGTGASERGRVTLVQT